MEEKPLLIVSWVNELLGPTVASLFGITTQVGHEVIPMHLIMGALSVVLLIVFSVIVRSRLSVENPGKLQLAMEAAVEFLNGQLEENIGHDGHKYLGMIGTLGFFIAVANLMGLIPGLGSATSNVNVPCGLAIFVFLYYNYQGMRKQGVLKYLKHFAGPLLILAPLMIPIEIISHIARPLSLTVRLWGNVYAEELLVGVFVSILPLFLPLPLMAFAIFGGLLQAFIFITMAQLYLGGAVATEDH